MDTSTVKGNTNVSKKPRRTKPEQESDDYNADKESVLGQPTSTSVAANLYDFENSEENIEEYSALNNITNSGKRRRVSKQHPGKIPKVTRIWLSSATNKTKKNNFKQLQYKPVAPSVVGNHADSQKCLRIQAIKRSSKSPHVFDSGVFMTPSPLQEASSSSVFHLSVSKKRSSRSVTATASSTPTGVSTQKRSNNTAKLSAPLLAPPDLSPVKKLQSPSIGGMHGGLLTSPDMAQVTPAIGGLGDRYLSTNALSYEVAEEEADAMPYKHLDISKTYDSICDRSKEKKKKGKSKKQSRYSVSKYEVWADKKATEFEEIEQFELSIEGV